ncbi:DsbA family protein [Oculatella sp. FACHB-28]|uniref:DsbA family protein n=1 Tax=Oculatella sp. FACHB-28 TaxID=2692845 RepID=UPI001687A3CA|nr:thioredoxin domain-containing protein [Oculatella sp. FACHB-28]MBD2057513.1 DsbA family protein [Oculatella sp. FACHB-28]
MSTHPYGETSQVIPPLSDRDHMRGLPNAKFVLMKYGDYQCPQSGRSHQLIKTIQQQLGEQFCFVFRHFPQPHRHPQSYRAAESAEASANQGKFWEMHDLLFENQQALDDSDIVTYAAQLHLDIPQFLRELSEHVHAERVEADIESGQQNGVAETPTFFVGIRCGDVERLEQVLLKVIALSHESDA